MPDPITFRPTEELGGFIEGLVEAGDYASQSEVIRDALRQLQEKHAASKLEILRGLIAQAEESPIVEDWNLNDFLKRARKKHNVST